VYLAQTYKRRTELKQRDWFEDFVAVRRERSPKTALIYRHAVEMWAKANESTPNKLIEAIRTRKVDVYDTLQKFASFMNGKLAPRSIWTNMTGVRQFLGFCRMPVAADEFKYALQGLPSKKASVSVHRAPSYSEARQMLLSVKPKARIALSLMLGGLRIGEVAPLRVENFNLDKDHPTLTIDPQNTKSNGQRIIPISRELRGLLIEYLGKRVEDPKALIFPSSSNANRSEWPQNIYHWIMYAVQQLGLKQMTGEGQKQSKRYLVHPHMLRKYFFQACIGSGVDRGLAEFWMGHEFSLDESYLEPEKLFEHFHKVEPRLTFLGTAPSDDIREQLEAQNITMRLRLKQQEDKIQSLERQIAAIDQYFHIRAEDPKVVENPELHGYEKPTKQK